MTPELIGAAILALIQASPEIVKLITDLMSHIQHIDQDDLQGFIKTVSGAMEGLNSAATEEQRQAAAKQIADAIADLY